MWFVKILMLCCMLSFLVKWVTRKSPPHIFFNGDCVLTAYGVTQTRQLLNICQTLILVHCFLSKTEWTNVPGVLIVIKGHMYKLSRK